MSDPNAAPEPGVDEEAVAAPAPPEAPAEAPAEPEVESGVKLNQNKPFAKIIGPEEHGARFIQGAEYFDQDGKHIPELSMGEVPKKPEPSEALAKKETRKPDPGPHTAQQGDVNLQRWIEGTEQHNWQVIKAAVKGATGQMPTNKPHAVQLLQQHGVINVDDMDQPDG